MENNLDNLFKSKLEGQEPEFHPTAWDRMEVLLEEEGLTPHPKKKPRRIGFILPILILGVVLSIIGYVNLDPTEVASEGSTLTNKIVTISDSEKQSHDTKETENHLTSESVKRNEQIKIETPIPSKSKSKSKSNLKSKSLYTPERNSVNSEYHNIEDPENLVNNDKQIDFNKAESQNQPAVHKLSPPIQANQNQKNSNELEAKNNNAEIKILETKLLSKATPTSDLIDSGEESIVEKSNSTVNDKGFFSIEFLQKLPFLELNYSNSKYIISPPIKIISPIVTNKSSLFEIGIAATFRSNNGLGYSIGPSVQYNLGRGYKLSFSGQYDMQKFESGPEFSVFDKEYSFGSTLSERKFSLGHQKSIRIPLSFGKSFDRFDMEAGLVIYQTMESSGDITAISDGSVLAGQSVDNQMIKPRNISFQLKAGFNFNRHLALSLGMEYKPKSFSEDQSTTNNQNTFYPSLGIRYSLLKF